MKVTVRTVLPHPPETVFDFVADMRNDPQWAPMVSSVEQLEGEGPGVGARWRILQQVGQREVPMEMTMTGHERPGLLRWAMDHAALDYESTMRLTPHRHGTRLVQTTTERWHRAPLTLKLVAPMLVRRQMRRQMALLTRALERNRLTSGGPRGQQG